MSKPFSIALGTVIVAGLGVTGMANATEAGADLFAMEELNSGYLIAGGHEKPKDEEGSCGGDKEGEGSCGDDKGDKKEEGKCGEGKCGSA